jgi:hypothetical protein
VIFIGVDIVANIEKEVVKKYKLELNEAEYHAFLSLLGAISYSDYRDFVNMEYSVQLHSGDAEKLKILSVMEHQELYNKIYDNK